ncbi:DedA family protein [Candidatus Pacearchaeota archaeon]|nr:MAG: DedA family protein [Candidatus Pacearchaeota archaeon]
MTARESESQKKIQEISALALVAVLFLAASYLAQRYAGFFERYVGNSLLGMLAYVFIVIVSIVIAPVSAVPLMPIATRLWGVAGSALLSIAGWTIGAGIAFQLGRIYGERLAKHVEGIEKVRKMSERIPESRVFLGVVLLRMLVPVDVLSYALALSTKIKFTTYILATLIGVSPFAFVLASLGKVPLKLQVIVVAIALAVFAAWRAVQGLTNNHKRKH